MFQVMKKSHPEWDEDKLEKNIEKIMCKRFKNPEVTLDNNYTHERRESTLLSVFDWAIETEPIIAGNGTFYKQHKYGISPFALMVDGFLQQRKEYKRLMFAVGDENSRKYKDYDLKQANEKILANSDYGIGGMPTSPFYSLWTAPSVTLSAQSVISTTETTFEAFLADNFIFNDVNELYHWIDVVLKEDVKLDDWVNRVDYKQCFQRLSSMVLGFDYDKDGLLMIKYLKSLSTEDLTRLYWKNQLVEFTRNHEYVQNIHDEIYSSVVNYEYIEDENDIGKIPKDLLSKFSDEPDIMKAWNKFVDKQAFYDPNAVPDTIQKSIDKLKDIYMKYVYVKYMPMDRMYRLKNYDRKVVTVIDTDSNILSLDTYMEYCLENLFKSTYGRDSESNEFIAVNTITYVITAVATDILLYYGERSNVQEDIRPRYNMKNEFYFNKLIIAKTKKRYMSRIILREGNRLLKPNYDVKGFDFKKATTSEDAGEFYMQTIKDLLLNVDNIDLKSLYHVLMEFKEHIKESVQKGETKYLPNGKAKEIEAYDVPGSKQEVRGALTWNMVHPDRMIEFPSNVSVLKLNIVTEEDMAPLAKTHPEIYKTLIDGVFHDDTGIFIRPKKGPKGKMVMACSGVQVLAIPSNAQIPEWVMPYIDYTTVINNILSPFKSVLEIFGMPGVEEGRTGRKTVGLSNIIKL